MLTNSNFYRSLTTTNIATGFFLENLKRIKKLNIFSGPSKAYLSGKDGLRFLKGSTQTRNPVQTDTDFPFKQSYEHVSSNFQGKIRFSPQPAIFYTFHSSLSCNFEPMLPSNKFV